MRPPKATWPDTPESRGVLMFAQLMREMLAPATFESFRVYSLDTTARLREAHSLVADVQRDRIPRAALDPVLTELNWSFQKDPVAKELAPHEIAEFSGTFLNQKLSLENLSARIVLLQKRFFRATALHLSEKLSPLFLMTSIE